MSKNMSKGAMIKWAVNIILPIIVFLIPCNDVYTMQMKIFLTTTLFAILCFALDTMNQTVVAVLLPVLWVYTGVADATVAFSPWTQFVPWMLVSGFFFAAALESSGLLARIAYFVISKTGGSYTGIIVGIAIASAFCTLFVGNVIIPMAAMTYGICVALETGKGKASAGIMLTAAMGCLVLGQVSMGSPIMLIGIGSAVTGPMELLGYFEAFILNAPIFLEYILCVIVVIVFFRPDHEIEGKTYFQEKLAELGKISVDEIKCICLLVVYLAYIIGRDIHGMPLEWGMVVLSMLVCVPGIGTFKQEDMKKINFSMVFFVTACMAIGSVAVSLGIGQIIIDLVLPVIQGKSHYVFFLVEWFTIVALNFVMTPLAIEASFTIPSVILANAVGINPMSVYYFILHTCDQIIFPYEYALYLIFFSFGMIRMDDFMKILGSKMVINFILVFAVLLPWWNFMGFLFV